MNKVILVGRLTRDPDVRYSQGEQSMAIARFSLAVDRRFKRDGDNQSADFISCVAFGKTAEFIEKYVHKGTKLVLEGRIQTGSYTNKDGVKVYTTDVVAENVEFAESKATAANYSNGGFEGAANEKPAGAPGDGFMNVADGLEDEGLPF
ncbi:MAG: single-stranded DNA-binding protein [Lachnospiraceae bacterium]|nr:single-stranded DNA-binding protein [Lachnospiraceae bacterium]